MTHARFYHAGCPVCISAEQTLLNLLDPALKVEVVHLGDPAHQRSRTGASRCLFYEGQVLHLNFGAAIDELK